MISLCTIEDVFGLSTPQEKSNPNIKSAVILIIVCNFVSVSSAAVEVGYKIVKHHHPMATRTRSTTVITILRAFSAECHLVVPAPSKFSPLNHHYRSLPEPARVTFAFLRGFACGNRRSGCLPHPIFSCTLSNLVRPSPACPQKLRLLEHR